MSPFDLYNLVQATGKDVETILEKYTDMFVGKNSHVPIVRLRYRQELDGTTTCYFLGRKDGKAYCRVQSHKPTVCRIYPLASSVVLQRIKQMKNLTKRLGISYKR